MELKPGYKQTEVGVIPEDWDVKRLGEVGEVRMCKRVLKHQTSEYGDVPFYKIGTFGSNPDSFISYKQFIEFSSKFSYPRQGDVLISAAGTIGRSVVFDGAPAYFQDSNIVWIDNDESVVLNTFLWFTYQVTEWAISHGGTVARLYNDSLRNNIYVPVPPIPEQKAIAEALSDMDSLLGGLDSLIAKKRDIKQATMQQLLTGKTRLPGFSGEWEVKRLGEVASLRRNQVNPVESGVEEFCLELEHFQSGTGHILGSTTVTDRSVMKSMFFEGDVLFGRLRAYLRKYWLATRSGVCSTEVWILIGLAGAVTPRFLYQVVRTDAFIDAAGTTYGTHMPRSDWDVVKNFDFPLPPLPEQQAIAKVLTDMDAELDALEQRRDKTRELKQAMMQELLTGRTRLV